VLGDVAAEVLQSLHADHDDQVGRRGGSGVWTGRAVVSMTAITKEIPFYFLTIQSSSYLSYGVILEVHNSLNNKT
jgi:hypothetical protein